MNDSLVPFDAPILVTGAGGFIGGRVVENLLRRGFRRVRCFVRPSSDCARLEKLLAPWRDKAEIAIVKGNLLSRTDCANAVKDIAVIYHLAAGRGEKMVADAFLNSVVTTRNLLEAARQEPALKRFVSVSSLSVYTNLDKPNGRLLDEQCPVEQRPEERGDAYTFAKTRQDEIIAEYGKKFSLPFVILRPGIVYGPGNEGIHGRVGLGSFGLFLHLGGSNALPLTYVDNCAEAIALAGIKPGVEGEVFNVVDDGVPSSRRFLNLYKKNVRHFRSLYVPRAASYVLCYCWEKYSTWSQGQLPPAFNRRVWHAFWKKTRYSNAKLKQRLGWTQPVSSPDALDRHFLACRQKLARA